MRRHLFATMAAATMAAAAAMAALACAATPAAGERIIVSLSNHRVMITPNFAGEELVLFGAIEREPNNPVRSGSYDVLATVTGPRQNLVTFRKDRMLGIWVNVDSRVFENAPAYLAVLSTRPLDAISNAKRCDGFNSASTMSCCFNAPPLQLLTLRVTIPSGWLFSNSEASAASTRSKRTASHS